MTWSVPVSNGFGRRLKFLVWDENNGKVAGLFALGDPVFNLSVRDNVIGWNSMDRAQRLVNILDAYVLGAAPPYNQLLGGKAVACLVRSREVFDAFQLKYGNAAGTISKVKKRACLLAVTTSSSLGRSSIYNRLNLHGTPYFQPIGFTSGWGHFHIPDQLFLDLREFLRSSGHKYADQNQFGQGPNWRMRTIRVALTRLGFDEGVLRHGIKREVFIAKFASNATTILKTGAGEPDLSGLRDISYISDEAVKRWMSPRSVRKVDFANWRRDDLFQVIRNGAPVPNHFERAQLPF